MRPSLPENFTEDATLELVTQGAEALVYRTIFLLPTTPACLKFRPRKAYRHPVLDARLTKHRLLSEARLLVRCKRDGVSVPSLFFVDADHGWMMTEWINGGTVRKLVENVLKAEFSEEHLSPLMTKIGATVGRLHASGVVHGDLTSSNLMLKLPNPERKESPLLEELLDIEVVLIDLGLGAVSSLDEDKAVDLYVLERAFISTHPKAEKLFPQILKSYSESHKGASIVLKRLEDVRMRGRKRSMVG
jgi:TP53 regulating kinase-like protein